ncbi:MAG TPA: polysaccharide deacetylase family protein [Chloroflexia bacterium]|nr:polysaccharide deacetylase family protein [Chloroflexia bacterium]
MGATGNNVTILAYHRIDTPANPDNLNLSPTLIDATPEAFEAQMKWLSEEYNVIPAWDLVGALRDGQPLPPRAVMITFDDGYNCYKDTALPILRRYGLPSTLFVPTAYAEDPHTPFWWDTLHKILAQTTIETIEVPGVGVVPLRTRVERDAAYSELVQVVEHTRADRVPQLVGSLIEVCGVEPAAEKHIIGWQEIEELAQDGDVAFAPHTRHHPILAQSDTEYIQSEIQGSWEDLQKHVQNPVPILAYPNGQPYAVNRASREAAQRAGLVAGVTMMGGANTISKADPFLLHRNGATAGQSLSRFKLSIGPMGGALRRVKRLLRPVADFS